jgi:hypothetical protein
MNIKRFGHQLLTTLIKAFAIVKDHRLDITVGLLLADDSDSGLKYQATARAAVNRNFL